MFVAGHAQAAADQRFTPMALGVVVRRSPLAFANLNPTAVHHKTRDGGHLSDWAPTPRGQRQLLIGLGLSSHLGDTLFTDALRPPLDTLPRNLYFRERFQVLARPDERRRLRTGIDHLPEHGRRERAIDFNADRGGPREKKPGGSQGKNTPVRQS